MPLPEALVTVTAVRIEGLPAAVASANHAYALVTIGSRVFGRSRKITAAGSFDLTAERESWMLALAVEAGTTVPVSFEVLDDRGDLGPNAITSGSDTLSSPFRAGNVVVGAVRGPRLVLSLTVVNATSALGGGRVTRAGTASAPSALLRPPRAVVLQFTEIKGLNKPGHNPGGLTRPLRRAEPQDDYISNDDNGRIYTDSDHDGNWSRDTQFIDLTVKITPHGVRIAGAKVEWTMIDPDDPFNDRSDVHREAGHYIDPNDYDASGTHIGALGNDNIRAYNEAGTGTERSIFDRLPPWEGIRGFGLSDRTNTSAKTTIDSSLESKVRLHCPDVGGTNLIVKAELSPAPSGVPMIPAQTGIMTMWKRIDVEVARMDGAFPLSSAKIASIADEYEAAFVQLDFHPERVMAATPAESPNHMAINDNLVENRTNAWIRRAFRHRRDPGWFFFGIAKRAHPPPPGASSPPLFDSRNAGATWSHGTSGRREFVEVNNRIGPTAAVVVFQWDHPNTTGSGTTPVSLFWIVQRQVRRASSTKLFLFGHDITSGFTGHDSNGSLTHAGKTENNFFPRGIFDARGRAVAGRSYEVPISGANQARILVLASDPGETSGISPGPPDFFAGQTVVFSHHPGFADHGTPASPNVPPTERSEFAQEVPQTVTHEFAHAFGMPHKCGLWDFKTPRRTSCCMNYFSHWLLVPGTSNQLDPFQDDKMGPSLCARHAMEIRRVFLKRNRGLRWR